MSVRLRALFLAAGLLPGLAVAAPGQQKGCGQLPLVERWHGSFSLDVDFTDQFRSPSQGGVGTEHAYHWNASGQFDLGPAVDSGGTRQKNAWRGDEQNFTVNAHEEEGLIGGGDENQYRTVSQSGALDKNGNSAYLSLNCGKGTYQFSVHIGRFKVKKTLELAPALVSFCEKARQRDPRKDAGALTGQLLCALLEGKKAEYDKEQGTFAVSASVEDQPFSPDNPSLSGSARVHSNYSLMNGQPLDVNLTWSLSPGAPSEAELVFDVDKHEEYEKWKPSPDPKDAAGKTYDGSGAPLLVKLKLQPKKPGGGAPSGRIDLELLDVSRHAGRCVNFPNNVASKDDLRFAPKERQPDSTVAIDDDKKAHTNQDVSEVVVAIEATDTGAYGKLRADCRRLSLRAEDKTTGKYYLSLPKDDNDNHVADAWEKEKGIYGENLAADWDEDPVPAKQRREGDGYTLYEEYRGFMTRDGFLRTNPKKKDLFILDPDHLAETHYAPYNPAELELHFLEEGMLKFSGAAKDPDNRWVNYNSDQDEDWYARQYAMYVKRWVGDVAGHAESWTLDRPAGADPYAAFKAPLKEIYIVKISTQALENALRGVRGASAVYNDQMAALVIHEMGHGIGIHHHWEGNRKPATGETEEMVQSGVFSCAMRYVTQAEYDHPELLKPQSDYCKAGQTWQRPGKKADGSPSFTFETVPSHDCFGQIDVKSDP